MSDEADRQDLRRFAIETATSTVLHDGLEGFSEVVMVAAIIENYVLHGIAGFKVADEDGTESYSGRH